MKSWIHDKFLGVVSSGQADPRRNSNELRKCLLLRSVSFGSSPSLTRKEKAGKRAGQRDRLNCGGLLLPVWIGGFRASLLVLV